MGASATEQIWRTTAIVMCAAVPTSFYVLGDITDAFPGVLTVQSSAEGPSFGPRAVAEDWERVAAEESVPTSVPGVAPVDPADLEERMAAPADLPVVAGGLAFSVVAAETGGTLAERDAGTALVPASTLKLLTAAAVLREYSGDEVLYTRAAVQDGVITLVGGGDMTLSEDDLRELATGAAALAAEQGTSEVSVALDDSYLDGGPNPAWGNNGRDGGWVTPTASLALEEGWLDGEQYGPKSATPARDAAARFAELLREAGLTVADEITGARAPEEAPTVEIHSETLAELVRHTLLISDNTTAELLAHLVALAHGAETTPVAAAAAVEAEIRELAAEIGVAPEAVASLEIRDGSGLSRQNRVSPALLSAVLAEVASGEVPALEQILFDVPIAGLSGTLADRFDAEGTEDASGLVRGKTGYLGGAATLAGVTVLPDGRTVGYSIAVHGFDGVDAVAARAAVDQVAAEMVQVD
ncbi:D-alanyl-D-alanine carboxypeptidase [Brachybacterium vulturis]|uniref:D-alanyl-D-alanine carboxypeptidase n=1 Tax=Brachybacterium vulturis TaxID=2017484 RepID=A0A291GQ91_9MICO|nr:D-alanyl-D-alanine carboxypeptidase [Brachybacterium vulturis]ATG52357.1 D-alanyl-D-alanine carboxypeptidase [Brachybacterium vulturis]